MEQNLAILIADLSGYTALTETHGASNAADLIDAYIEIVNDCLVGDCHLHQRTGDEVLIVSSSPDDLMVTAIMLLQQTSRKENFLQIHGGLHFGKILKRKNDYYGTTINLTARIASQANPGRFCCSEDFKSSLSDKTGFMFHSKGKCDFKNISEKIEVFELGIDQPYFHVDPVCRMLIPDPAKATRHPDTENLFFCSSDCLEKYKRKQLV